MLRIYNDFEYRILHAFLCGLPRRGREKGMTIINRRLIYKQEYPLSFYFMNVLCPGFTVLVPEWTCNNSAIVSWLYEEKDFCPAVEWKSWDPRIVT